MWKSFKQVFGTRHALIMGLEQIHSKQGEESVWIGNFSAYFLRTRHDSFHPAFSRLTTIHLPTESFVGFPHRPC